MTGLDQMVACVERELAMRRRVYPRWVAGGKTTQASADKELATMDAVLALLKAERDSWRPMLRGADGEPRTPADHQKVLVSWYGFDGSGNGVRHPHVSIDTGGAIVRLPNVYAWRPMIPAAPLPPGPPAQPKLI